MNSIICSEHVIKHLEDGNSRFANCSAFRPNQDEYRRQVTTAAGQQPVAAILSCSDSRVPVEILFDQGIGDLFTVRVAGNTACDSATGSMEYAVEHLGVRLVIVMGHSHCGAVTAAVKFPGAASKTAGIVEKIRVVAQKTIRKFDDLGDQLIDTVAKENVREAIRELRNKSHILHEMEESGELQLRGAFYNIETGKVEWLD
jgi:carbonic anhydrase